MHVYLPELVFAAIIAVSVGIVLHVVCGNLSARRHPFWRPEWHDHDPPS
jgi:hypothetical protein